MKHCHLVGRAGELARLDHELGITRAGTGSVLILRGEAGTGKSALLENATERARKLQVIRFRGIQAEQGMPYSGLHLLYITLRAQLQPLDHDHLGAVDAVFCMSANSREPYLAGQALLSLLTGAIQKRPSLLVIDDAHWLDKESATTIAFLLRRLEDQPIFALVATRELTDDVFADLPDIRVGKLSEQDARALIADASVTQIDEILAGQIVAESRCKPGAILEVLAGTTSPEFAGSYSPASPDRYPSQAQDALATRLAALDPDERRLLMLAAADPTGDPVLLWQAAAVLGIKPTAGQALIDQGWLEFGSRVLLRSPAERSATYRCATTEERSALHHALAQVTDPTTAPDRRSWHLANATIGLDESLADALAGYADLAQRRSGWAGAAAFLERAARLTVDPRLRSERALAAAAARFNAGSAEGSSRMLVTAELGRLDQSLSAEVERQRARVAFFNARNGAAAQQLLDAAPYIRTSDGGVSREGYLEALVASVYAGRLGPGPKAYAQMMPADFAPESFVDSVLAGLTAHYAPTPNADPRTLVRSLRAPVHPKSLGEGRQWLWLAALMAADEWDEGLWLELTSEAHDAALDAGSLMLSPHVLTVEALAELHVGNIDQGQRMAEEIDAIAASTQAPRFYTAAMLVAAWQGDEQAAEPLIGAARRDAMVRGEGIILTVASLASSVLYNGLGRYAEAFSAAQDAAKCDELAVSGWALVELVEAAARSGQPEIAASALTRLTQRTQAAGTDWALGMEARSRGLLADDSKAERCYAEAVDRLGRTESRAHLARAQLVYGEWLRRQSRQVDGRIQLKAAAQAFDEIGAAAFAARAHREYLATSDKLRRNVTNQGTLLTPQEARIAELVELGLTNPEIGQRLFLSSRTVEYHLNKVFRKRGISSRRELLYRAREMGAA